jgi:putative DNA primase/helicase
VATQQAAYTGRRKPAGQQPPYRAGVIKYGEYLRDRIIGAFRWSPGLGWLAWDGAAWRPAVEEQLICPVRDMIAAVAPDVIRAGGQDQMRELYAMSSGSGISGIIRVARGLPDVFTPDALWDQGATDAGWVLPCANGCTVELHPDGTYTVRASRPDDLRTATACEYWQGAEAPEWLHHFGEYQPDQVTREWLMRVWAGALRGVQIQQFHVWYGETAGNGKGTTQSALSAVFRDFAYKIPVAALMRTGSGSAAEYRDEIARLRGKRIVFTDEPEEGQRFAAGRICELTGGSTISARAMYRGAVEFTPQFLLTMASNKRPRWSSHSGLERRYVETPWDFRVDPGRQDPGITDRICAEAPGVLNLLLAAWSDWIGRGLKPPDQVARQTARGRAEADTVRRFISARLRDADSTWPGERGKGVYDAYKAWCDAEGEQKSIRPNRELVAGMRDAGWEVKHTKTGNFWPVRILDEDKIGD